MRLCPNCSSRLTYGSCCGYDFMDMLILEEEMFVAEEIVEDIIFDGGW